MSAMPCDGLLSAKRLQRASPIRDIERASLRRGFFFAWEQEKGQAC